MRKGLVVLLRDFGKHWLQSAKRFKIQILGLHANPFQISVDDILRYGKILNEVIG